MSSRQSLVLLWARQTAWVAPPTVTVLQASS